MNPDEERNGLGTGTKHPATNLRLVPPKPPKSTTIMPQREIPGHPEFAFLEGPGHPELTCLLPEQLEAIDGIAEYTGLSRSEAIRMIVFLGLEALGHGLVIEGGGGGR